MKSPKDCKFCGKPIGEGELFSSYIKHLTKENKIDWFHEKCYVEVMDEMGEDSPF